MNFVVKFIVGYLLYSVVSMAWQGCHHHLFKVDEGSEESHFVKFNRTYQGPFNHCWAHTFGQMIATHRTISRAYKDQLIDTANITLLLDNDCYGACVMGATAFDPSYDAIKGNRGLLNIKTFSHRLWVNKQPWVLVEIRARDVDEYMKRFGGVGAYVMGGAHIMFLHSTEGPVFVTWDTATGREIPIHYWGADMYVGLVPEQSDHHTLSWTHPMSSLIRVFYGEQAVRVYVPGSPSSYSLSTTVASAQSSAWLAAAIAVCCYCFLGAQACCFISAAFYLSPTLACVIAMAYSMVKRYNRYISVDSPRHEIDINMAKDYFDGLKKATPPLFRGTVGHHKILAHQRRTLEGWVINLIKQSGFDRMRDVGGSRTRYAELGYFKHICAGINSNADIGREEKSTDVFDNCRLPGQFCPHRNTIPAAMLSFVDWHLTLDELLECVTGPTFVINHSFEEGSGKFGQFRTEAGRDEEGRMRYENNCEAEWSVVNGIVTMRSAGGTEYNHRHHMWKDEGEIVGSTRAAVYYKLTSYGDSNVYYVCPAKGVYDRLDKSCLKTAPSACKILEARGGSVIATPRVDSKGTVFYDYVMEGFTLGSISQALIVRCATLMSTSKRDSRFHIAINQLVASNIVAENAVMSQITDVAVQHVESLCLDMYPMVASRARLTGCDPFETQSIELLRTRLSDFVVYGLPRWLRATAVRVLEGDTMSAVCRIMATKWFVPGFEVYVARGGARVSGHRRKYQFPSGASSDNAGPDDGAQHSAAQESTQCHGQCGDPGYQPRSPPCMQSGQSMDPSVCLSGPEGGEPLQSAEHPGDTYTGVPQPARASSTRTTGDYDERALTIGPGDESASPSCPGAVETRSDTPDIGNSSPEAPTSLDARPKECRIGGCSPRKPPQPSIDEPELSCDRVKFTPLLLLRDRFDPMLQVQQPLSHLPTSGFCRSEGPGETTVYMDVPSASGLRRLSVQVRANLSEMEYRQYLDMLCQLPRLSIEEVRCAMRWALHAVGIAVRTCGVRNHSINCINMRIYELSAHADVAQGYQAHVIRGVGYQIPSPETCSVSRRPGESVTIRGPAQKRSPSEVLLESRNHHQNDRPAQHQPKERRVPKHPRPSDSINRKELSRRVRFSESIGERSESEGSDFEDVPPVVRLRPVPRDGLQSLRQNDKPRGARAGPGRSVTKGRGARRPGQSGPHPRMDD